MDHLFPDDPPAPAPSKKLLQLPAKKPAKTPPQRAAPKPEPQPALRPEGGAVPRPRAKRGADGAGGGATKPDILAKGTINEMLQLLAAQGLTIAGSRAAPRMKRAALEDARFEAQDLAYAAMEAGSGVKAAALCKRALAIDPDCVDALVLLARSEKLSKVQFEDRLRQAVAAGERSLGKKAFKELRGMFWGFMETRPYMRARIELANLLSSTNREAEAISHYEELLELNTDDNNGLRYILVSLLIKLRQPARAAHWLERYKEDESAFFTWATVLLRVAMDDEAGAAKALRAARESNPHAEAYLSGAKKLTQALPDYYSPGQDSEAQHAADTLLPAFDAYPQARAWLLAKGVKAEVVTARKGSRSPRQA